MNRFLFLLLLVFLAPPLPAIAASPTPADILLVCNSAMKGSCGVARHYARKRKVPLQNLIRLALPTSESISRSAYETELAAPLRQRVKAFMAKRQRCPILLLVYGVPLKIAPVPAGRSRQVSRKLVRARVAALTGQIRQDLDHLGQWTERGPVPVSGQGGDPEALLQRSARVVQQSIEFLRTASRESRRSFHSMQIQAVVLQLAGIAPVARSLAIRAEMWRPKLRRDLFQSAPVLQMHQVLQARLGRISFRGVTAANVLDLAAAFRMDQGLLGELRFWLSPEVRGKDGETGAAVDSELSLLLADPHALKRWLANPFLEKYDGYPGIKALRGTTLMVARLDGPTPKIAERLVDDAIEVEQKGLTGIFYIDARGLPGGKSHPYGEYDQHLRNLARILTTKTSFPVVLDNRPELFPVNSCPHAALYCGWYSLGHYRDSFGWQKGAVGFHVASREAATLRKPGSQVWCKRMLEKGVAATLGPVEEPYLQSFPLPDRFFPLLMTGKLTLVEVYYRTLPFLSWRQILIGDPLYRPFRKHPAFTASSSEFKKIIDGSRAAFQEN